MDKNVEVHKMESIILGKTYDAKIEKIGDKGTPMTFIGKMVCFVDGNCAIGDTVKIKIIKIKEKFCFAEVSDKSEVRK